MQLNRENSYFFSFMRYPGAVLAVFGVLGFSLYWKTLFFDYTFLDDAILYSDNFLFLKNIENFFEIFRRDVFLSLPNENANYYRPLMNVSLMADAFFSRHDDLTLPHFMNIVYHVSAVMLLYLLLNILNYDKVKSFFLSVIFLVHPVLTQAVAWLPGRNDSLTAIFIISAFITLVNSINKFSIWNIIMHIIFFTLSLFCKETSIMMVSVFGFYLFLHRKNIKNEKWIFIVLWVIITVMWWNIRSHVLVNAYSGYTNNILSNIIYNSPILIQSLGKIFFPFHLSVLPTIDDTGSIWGLITLLLLVLLLILFVNKVKNNLWTLFGIVWFLVFMIPPLVVRNPNLSHQLHFEHRLYIPMIGLIFFFLELFKGKNGISIQMIFSFIALIILFSILTFLHENNFKNRFLFWENALKTSPSSSVTHVNIGANLALLNKSDLAIISLRKALAINPNEQNAHNEIGAIFLNANMLNEAEKEFIEELKIYANSYKAMANLGVVYLNRGEFDLSMQLFSKTIKLNPRHANTYSNMGFCFLKMQKFEEAELAWKKTIELDPKHLSGHFNLINFYAERKRYKEAMKLTNTYLQLGGQLNPRLFDEIKAGNY